ncbi:zinc-ribbon domain-containing protein [Kitasatospora sp. NPDC059648]|uniref:NADase-type glycan-binding domain-containing protein n=1 Tax=Kitasatospora sp. NPDC059648 TaxID=3346894 RepID=UPI0036C0AB48
MPVCPDCGTVNGEGDDFCGNCGAYLGWSRTAAAAPAPVPAAPARTGPEPVPTAAAAETGSAAQTEPAAPAPAPAPDAPVTGRTETTWRNVSRRVTARSRRNQPTAPAAGPPTEPVVEPPAQQVHGPSPSPTPEPVPPSTAAESKADPKADPKTEPKTEPQADPVAVQPAKPVAPRPVVRASAADEGQDGPPCPRCGTPNLPERRFCRRCAAPLSVTTPPPKLPWWRTRWPFRRRVRIGGSGNALRRTIALAVLAALVVAGILLYPVGVSAFQDVLDKVRSTAPITPSLTSASAAVEGRPATAAVDGLSNTYWGAPAVGDSVSFTFRTPFRLVDLIIHTGASADPEQFRGQARPLVLSLEVTSSDRELHRKEITLNDQPGPQTVATGISDVVQVKLTVREAAGTGSGRTIALAEVEFFKRT